MKQRIISALVGVALLIFLLVARDTFIFNLAVALISGLAVSEILHCAQIRRIGIYIPCVAFCVLVPFIVAIPHFVPVIAFAIVFCLAMFIIYLKNHQTIRYESIGTAIATTFFVAFSFGSLICLKDIDVFYPTHFTKEDGLFLLLMVLICSWATDSGAYFAGVFFGKHKLAPTVSPKKTIEGAVGGVIVCVLVNLLSAFIFNKYIFQVPHVSYWVVAVLSLVLSIIGMLGDLNASLIKRNFNAKDFGHIMPGHGGIMDRFDSVSFVAPALYALMIFAANF